uniref:Uncharacterized protein n=1 Tax=Parascaris univalens TaxID=6257 RepID=A0A915A0P7_PARUN
LFCVADSSMELSSDLSLPSDTLSGSSIDFSDDAISVSPSPSSVFRATSDSSMHSCKFLSRKQSFLCT